MSADNGVYILRTPCDPNDTKPEDTEYRVAEMSNVGDIFLYLGEDYVKGGDPRDNDPDVWIKNARDRWGSCQVFYNSRDALVEAGRKLEETLDHFGVCEYGINYIDIDRVF